MKKCYVAAFIRRHFNRDGHSRGPLVILPHVDVPFLLFIILPPVPYKEYEEGHFVACHCYS